MSAATPAHETEAERRARLDQKNEMQRAYRARRRARERGESVRPPAQHTTPDTVDNNRALFRQLREQGKTDEVRRLKQEADKKRKEDAHARDDAIYQRQVAAAAKARAARAAYIKQGIKNGRVRDDKPPKPKPGQQLTFKPPAVQTVRGNIPLDALAHGNGHRHAVPKRNGVTLAHPRIIDIEVEDRKGDGRASDMEEFADFVVSCWKKYKA